MTFLFWVSTHIDAIVQTLTVLVAAAGALNRWAVANKRDRLAMFTAALSRSAGRVREAAANIPIGVDPKAFIRQLILREATSTLQEWDTTGPKIGATLEKAVGIIEGEIGKIPTPGVAAPITTAAVLGLAR